MAAEHGILMYLAATAGVYGGDPVVDEVNRMEEPVCPATLDEVTLANVEVLECPYPTYALLREQAPVFQDPLTGIFVVTRYEDQRRIALDYDNFSNFRPIFFP